MNYLSLLHSLKEVVTKTESDRNWSYLFGKLHHNQIERGKSPKVKNCYIKYEPIGQNLK